MSKFNTTKSTKSRETTNHMGAKAYNYDEKFELVSTMLTTFVEDTYYRKGQDTTKRLVELTSIIEDKRFIAQAILFARKEFNMRSVSHLMAAELAATLSGKTYAKNFYEQLVVRPDDMTETLAAFKSLGGTTMPNAMKKGFAKAFDKFDGYQLAKYRGEKKAVKLVDLVNLIHPTPTQGNAKALQDLVDGKLRNTQTWEAKLTETGKDAGTSKRAAWEDLILQEKLGYMALLRNLRNILQANISNRALDKALAYLTNPKAVANSKQFPFRFLSAYQEVSKISPTSTVKKLLTFEKDGVSQKRIDKVLKAIEIALNTSIANLPLLAGETVILTDNSGSMRGDNGGSSAISAMSKRTSADIANLFATMYWSRAKNTLIGLFGDRLEMPTLDRSAGLFTNFFNLHKVGGTVGYGTETGIFTMFERLLAEKRKPARIVIFSDMQIGTGCSWFDTKGRKGADFNKLWESYRAFHPDVKVYSVDLRGYGTTVFKGNVFKMAGWSDKIFNIMEILEQDKNALISAIEAIEI